MRGTRRRRSTPDGESRDSARPQPQGREGGSRSREDDCVEAQTRRDVERALVDKALADPEFGRQLVANPKATVQRHLGIELPGDIEIEVLQATPQHKHLVLPATPPAGTTLPSASAAQTETDAVVLKAWQDGAFKSRLMADPKAALEQELDRSFPKELEFEVREETERQLYLVLPASAADAELSSAELDAVAGGAWTLRGARAGLSPAFDSKFDVRFWGTR